MITTHNGMQKRLVLFKSQSEIDNIKSSNVYRHNDTNIAIDHIIFIPISDNHSVNDIPAIPLAKDHYRNIPRNIVSLLLNYAMNLAPTTEYRLNIKVWPDAASRETGTPIIHPVIEYLSNITPSDTNDNILPGEILMAVIENIYNRYGCVEIVAESDEDEIYFYHQEVSDEYLIRDLFEFIGQV